MRIYAFDLDNTLFVSNTLLFTPRNHPFFNAIANLMLDAVRRGNEIWILTANFLYRHALIEKLFAQFPELSNSIKIFNGNDIAAYLGISFIKILSIHYQGRKGEFLMRKSVEIAQSRGVDVECVLYDDTDSQINSVFDINERSPRASNVSIKLVGISTKDFMHHPIGNFLFLHFYSAVHPEIFLPDAQIRSSDGATQVGPFVTRGTGPLTHKVSNDENDPNGVRITYKYEEVSGGVNLIETSAHHIPNGTLVRRESGYTNGKYRFALISYQNSKGEWMQNVIAQRHLRMIK